MIHLSSQPSVIDIKASCSFFTSEEEEEEEEGEEEEENNLLAVKANRHEDCRHPVVKWIDW